MPRVKEATCALCPLMVALVKTTPGAMAGAVAPAIRFEPLVEEARLPLKSH